MEATDVVSARLAVGANPERCPSVGGTDIRFRYAKDVERVEVYDVAGQHGSLPEIHEITRNGIDKRVGINYIHDENEEYGK